MVAKKGILGILGNTKAMKQAEKTFTAFGDSMKQMQQGNLQQLLNSFLEIVNSPMMVALDITIAKLNEELMPMMMPLMEDIASGKYDAFIDGLVKVLALGQMISFGPIVKVLEGINALIMFLSNLSNMGPLSEEALNILFPDEIPPWARRPEGPEEPEYPTSGHVPF